MPLFPSRSGLFQNQEEETAPHSPAHTTPWFRMLLGHLGLSLQLPCHLLITHLINTHQAPSVGHTCPGDIMVHETGFALAMWTLCSLCAETINLCVSDHRENRMGHVLE